MVVEPKSNKIIQIFSSIRKAKIYIYEPTGHYPLIPVPKAARSQVLEAAAVAGARPAQGHPDDPRVGDHAVPTPQKDELELGKPNPLRRRWR